MYHCIRCMKPIDNPYFREIDGQVYPVCAPCFDYLVKYERQHGPLKVVQYKRKPERQAKKYE